MGNWVLLAISKLDLCEGDVRRIYIYVPLFRVLLKE